MFQLDGKSCSGGSGAAIGGISGDSPLGLLALLAQDLRDGKIAGQRPAGKKKGQCHELNKEYGWCFMAPSVETRHGTSLHIPHRFLLESFRLTDEVNVGTIVRQIMGRENA